MKRLLPLAIASLLLAACVDTTGLSETSSKGPDPKSNPSGTVMVVEFADFQCPACKTAYTAINKPLVEKYGQQIRFEFHHFPLQSLHRFALRAAEASECAADQGKFWEFVDLDYAEQDKLSKTIFGEWAKELNLDTDLFNRCLASGIKRDAILAEYSAGQTAGVHGTPTYFVNGTQVASTLADLSRAIEAALQEQEKKM